MKNDTIKIAFLGTPEFALPALEALIATYQVPLVFSAPDDSKKGASPVARRARKLGIHVVTSATVTPSAFTEMTFDLFVIAAYGKILPHAILSIPKHGVINIHPSLLPRHRGASPIQSAILAGDTKSGVSIMFTDEKMDHGPILTQKKLTLDLKETSITLTKKLSALGAKLLVDTIPKYIEGLITPTPQNHPDASFTKLLTKQDGRIDWARPAVYIERMIRAYLLWPTTWSYFTLEKSKLRVTLSGAHISETIQTPSTAPGSIQTKNGDLLVATSTGYLAITELQPEGKKTMSGKEFVRGYIKGAGAAFVSDI